MTQKYNYASLNHEISKKCKKETKKVQKKVALSGA